MARAGACLADLPANCRVPVRSNADQRNAAGDDKADTRPSHEQGKENSHQNLDAKDEKSIKNKLDQASKEEKRQEREEAEDDEKPTDAARKNGNEPSRGAKIDEKIEDEEAALIAKMDEKKKNK